MLIQNYEVSEASEAPALIILVKKKNHTYHKCIDYCVPSKITFKDLVPIPLVSILVDAIGNAKIFSKI